MLAGVCTGTRASVVATVFTRWEAFICTLVIHSAYTNILSYYPLSQYRLKLDKKKTGRICGLIYGTTIIGIRVASTFETTKWYIVVGARAFGDC